jgi:quercetin dioxygenase-like cupin family protein
MLISKRVPNFIDHRGEITDIIDGVDVNSITLMTSKKGAVRGNHYHKQTIQYLYLIKGKLEYYTQQGDNEIEKTVLLKGDFVETPKNVKHAFRALEDSTFIACCSGLRAGKQYEEDTFRLEKPIND